MRDNAALHAFRPLVVAFLGLALGIALSLFAAAAKAPQADAAVVRSVANLSLSGTVFHPATAENVAISGSVDVTAIQTPGEPCHIQVKLTDATATGNLSGNTYRALGTQNFQPGDPCRAATISRAVSFRLLPGNPVVPPNPIHEFPVNLSLSFDEAGGLIEGESNATIGGVT